MWRASLREEAEGKEGKEGKGEREKKRGVPSSGKGKGQGQGHALRKAKHSHPYPHPFAGRGPVRTPPLTVLRAHSAPPSLPSLSSATARLRGGAEPVSPSASASASATATPPPNSTLTSGTTEATGGGIITVTASDGEITIPLSNLPGTIVVEPSGGAPPDNSSTASSGFITIFKTVAPTATATLTEIISEPITVTLEETFVSTFTAPGQTVELTFT